MAHEFAEQTEILQPKTLTDQEPEIFPLRRRRGCQKQSPQGFECDAGFRIAETAEPDAGLGEDLLR